MVRRLVEIAEVRAGITLRGTDAALRAAIRGPYFLRIGDLTDDGELTSGIPRLASGTRVVPEGRGGVFPGDILMANRGSRLTAALVREPLHAVAGSQLFLVRPRSQDVLPEFLHAFLNLSSTRAHLWAQARGTYVRSLPIGLLKALPVPLPSLPDQETIADLAGWAVEERRLLVDISRKRALLLELSLNRLLAPPNLPVS